MNQSALPEGLSDEEAGRRLATHGPNEIEDREGERLAADGIAREAGGLAVDESLLTGESVPVRKQASQQPADAGTGPVGGDDTPLVYASTLVISGHGVVEVLATGRDTRVGRIGASLASIETAPTPLQRQLRRLVQGFGAAAAVTSTVLVVWYGLQRGEWRIGWRALFGTTALAFWGVAGAATAALTVAVAVPGARRLLHFGVPDLGELALGIAAVAAAVCLGAALGLRGRGPGR